MKCLLIGAILAAAPAAQPEIPQYQVRRAASRIVVDGKADDKAWENAVPIELMFP